MSVCINPLNSFRNLHRLILIDHHLFSDSPIAGHLFSVQIFAVMNSSAGNTLTTIAAATAPINPEKYAYYGQGRILSSSHV